MLENKKKKWYFGILEAWTLVPLPVSKVYIKCLIVKWDLMVFLKTNLFYNVNTFSMSI